jgi:DNA uptake protein ComE-like DNA-binding protein
VRARAAALLAALALGAAAPRAGREAARCPAPQVVPGAGALVTVRCDESGGAASPSGAERLLFALRLDLNRAGPRALEALPGIGAERAQAIVRERAARPFCTLEEIQRVPGIGAATRARLAAWVEAGADAACPRS